MNSKGTELINSIPLKLLNIDRRILRLSISNTACLAENLGFGEYLFSEY